MLKLSRLDGDRIIELYTRDHLTVRQIAERFRVSGAAISYRLRSRGIVGQDGTWVDIACDYCGAELRVRRARWRKQGHFYCCTEHYYAVRGGAGYKPWRQGQRLARAIVAQYFNLQPEHVVHHEDKDNANNDRNNLKVFTSQSEHLKYHHGKKTIIPLWDGAKLFPIAKKD